MLNIITITSIKATIQQAETNPCNDLQEPSLTKYNTNSVIDKQEDGNMQSVSNTSKSKNSNYFYIESQGQENLHSFQEAGQWANFDSTRYFVNQTVDGAQEYLYCYENNQIYTKPLVRYRYSIRKYQSPIIKKVMNNKVYLQILVNDPQTHEFDSKCIARGNFILFFTLMKHDQKVCVSSVILFFKHQKKIYCSIRQIKPGFSFKKAEGRIQRNRQDFIEKSILKSFKAIPEHAVRQVEMILEYVDYVSELLNLKDSANSIKIVYRNKQRRKLEESTQSLC